MKSVSSFFIELQQKQPTHRVTVINHNNQARVLFHDEAPSKKLAKTIDYVKGGNHFNKPLIKALDIMKSCHGQFDRFVLYFMADGEGSFPYKAVEQF
mmetsp:Transcript_19055/g.29237  ORF Transcript_19055/g.29237 Transcript_19055/m.29237 type:complete len:97 (-) Transcript_19055:256-546(-)